ncbi:MAG: hypothetical protein JXA96_14220 [Sedimentisphaerales bacterium]|nr:hypothetical protein [Sedimentisphaerales bacterium]
MKKNILSPFFIAGRVFVRKISFILVFYFLLFFSISCSPNNIIDTLPPNTPKGYVKFDYLKSEARNTVHKEIDIYAAPSINEDAELAWSHIADLKLQYFTSDDHNFNNPYIIIAQPPGKYLYRAKYEPIYESSSENTSFDLSTPIEVKENMLTQVRIHFYDFTYKRHYGGITYYYKIKLWPGEPVPFTLEK